MLLALPISFLMLLFSSLFSWGDNPVMGYDKAVADTLITCVSIGFIRLFGLWDNAGFRTKSFLMFMNPITLVVQVINAASAGELFAAIFIKCKNIWAGVVAHAMVDWLSLFVANCFTGEVRCSVFL